jgi:hypothetical protein
MKKKVSKKAREAEEHGLMDLFNAIFSGKIDAEKMLESLAVVGAKAVQDEIDREQSGQAIKQ